MSEEKTNTMDDRQIATTFAGALIEGDDKKVQEMLPTLTEYQKELVYFRVPGDKYQTLMDLGVQPTPTAVCYSFANRKKDAEYWFSTGVDLGVASNISTPLMSAAEKGYVKLVQRLLSHGVDPNKKLGTTALILAVQNNNCVSWKKITTIVHLLLEHGADPNGTDMFGRTPLFCCHNLELVRFLRSKTPDINRCQNGGKNLLHFTHDHGSRNIELVRYFIAEGVDVNKEDGCGETPLEAYYSDYESFKLLLDAGAKVTENVKKLLLRFSRDSAVRPAVRRIVALLQDRYLL